MNGTLQTLIRMLFERGYLLQDVDFKLTDADSRDLTQYVMVYPEKVMGMSCMQMVIPIDDDMFGELANSLFIELRCINAEGRTYAECKLAIPIEKQYRKGRNAASREALCCQPGRGGLGFWERTTALLTVVPSLPINKVRQGCRRWAFALC